MNYAVWRTTFRLATQHNSLANWMEVTWAMMFHHKWSLEDAENVTPWEMSYYIELTKQHIQKMQAAKAGQDVSGGPPPEMETILKKRAIEDHARSQATPNK